MCYNWHFVSKDFKRLMVDFNHILRHFDFNRFILGHHACKRHQISSYFLLLLLFNIQCSQPLLSNSPHQDLTDILSKPQI